MTSLTAPRWTALSGWDLINVGVFTAIYFVVMFTFGKIGFTGPAECPAI
ncbi:MptD family putative ECF transporter S component [Austwickia chelonae]|nr:MptD family putative ECF transporter S component [Austwickia chelonae]